MTKRVYVWDGSRCIPTNFGCDCNGNISTNAITNPAPVSIKQAAGFPIISPAKLAAITSQSLQKKSNMVQSSNLSVAEKTGGVLANAALSIGSISGGNNTWSVTVDNTDTNAYTFVLFDALGLISDSLSLPALNGVVVNSGGTFDSLTLAAFKNITASIPVKLRGLHVQSGTLTIVGAPANPAINLPAAGYTVADSDSFFTAGRMAISEANLLNQAPKESPLNFQRDFKANTFNSQVREREDFEMQADSMHGLKITIPALTRVVITTEVIAAAMAFQMVEL